MIPGMYTFLALLPNPIVTQKQSLPFPLSLERILFTASLLLVLKEAYMCFLNVDNT